MPTITIPKGATLSGLAQQYGTTVSELMRLNPQIKDPNVIYAGASLTIPATPTPATTLTQQLTPAQQAAQIEAKIKQIQSEIQKRQAAIAEAQKAGITTGEIPAEILSKHGLIELPTTPPKTPFVDQILDSADISLKKILAEQYAEQQRLAKLQEKIETEKKSWFEKTKEAILGRSSYEKLLEKERTKWKVPEFYEKLTALTPEIDALNQRLIQINNEEQRALLTSEQRMSPMTFIRGEQALIQRQYAIQKSTISAELGAKTALAEMYRGNIDMANRLISQTIEAQLYDINQKIDDYKFFFNYYDDYAKTLDTKKRNALTNIMNLLIRQEEFERKDLELKYDLIKSAWNAGVDPGLTSAEIKEKSYEEIMAIVSPKIATAKKTGEEVWTAPYTLPTGETAQRNIKTGEIRIISKEGIGIGLTIFDDVLQEAIDAGATPQGAVEAAQIYANRLGITLKADDLGRLLTKAKELKPTPLSPPLPPVTPTPEMYGAALREAPSRIISGTTGWLRQQIGEMKSFFGALFGR